MRLYRLLHVHYPVADSDDATNDAAVYSGEPAGLHVVRDSTICKKKLNKILLKYSYSTKPSSLHLILHLPILLPVRVLRCDDDLASMQGLLRQPELEHALH